MAKVLDTIAPELNQARDLTLEEFSRILNTPMNHHPIYIKSRSKDKDVVELPFARWISPEEGRNHGLWEILGEAREILARKDFFAFYQNNRGSSAKKYRGNGYDLTLTTLPGHHAAGIHLSTAAAAAAKPGNEEMQRLIERVTVLFSMADEIVFRISFDAETTHLFSTAYKDRAIAEASLINGHHMCTGTQINYIPVSIVSWHIVSRCVRHIVKPRISNQV